MRQSFATHGLVTDIQLKYTKDGKFRNFAFVGYKTDDEAKKAQTYFNNSYFGASKIQVDFCANLGDVEKKPRAWSKYSKDSTEYQKVNNAAEEEKPKSDKAKRKEKKRLKAQKQKEVDQLMAKHRDDPKFQEFLRVHQRNATDNSWNNDAILEVGKQYVNKDAESEEDSHEEEIKEATNLDMSDLDYLKSKGLKNEPPSKMVDTKPKRLFFTIKLENLPCTAKKRDVKKFIGPNMGVKSIRVPRQVKGIAFVGFATEEERKVALKKDKSFIGSSQIHVRPYDIDRKSAEMGLKVTKWKQQEESLANLDETIGQSGRLFIRNLSYSVTEQDIETLFKNYGPLAEVHVPLDKMTKQIKGFAFVTFVIPENAVQAFTSLDGTAFQGRLLHIIPGQPPNEDTNEETSGSNFKQKKADKLKKQAQSSHNWNTLFLGAGAVAEVMSDKYQVSKQDVLLSSGDTTAAVRLALGETQIVEDTRKFLESEGVKLQAFEGQPQKRSKTIIIVKNLPAKTPIEAIRNQFAAHGELQRLVMPPSCPTCLVEFTEPSEARKAFKSLAYINFNGNPLYLEWAPEDTFSRPADKSQITSSATTSNVENESPLVEENATLFVKNLNFATDDTSLRSFFEDELGSGSVHEVSVAKKKDVKNPGNLLSMGYGFVQFKRSSVANEALKTLQHRLLDGHSIELKRSSRAESANQTVKTSKKVNNNGAQEAKASAKMVVRNVPFEATQKEVQDIFATFGTLKSVRLPKKVTGSHRGFAFVEFMTKEEAIKAYDKLCHSTHLYGRRLVLEWASQEETLEDLRKRTNTQYSADEPASKRVKKSKLIESVQAAA